MHEYPLEMYSGHLLIHHDGRAVLLDTGTPVSMGQVSSFPFLGREFPLHQQYNGLTVQDVSEIVRFPLDVVLGTDVLGQFAVVIDPETGRVVFGEDRRYTRPYHTPLGTLGGIPVVDIGLRGRGFRALLHTGATLSCLPDLETKAYRSVGVARDVYPGLGEFTTELRSVPMVIGDEPVTLVCGIMPPALEQALGRVGVQGVLGTNLLRAFLLGWTPGFRELHLLERRIPADPSERLATAPRELLTQA